MLSEQLDQTPREIELQERVSELEEQNTGLAQQYRNLARGDLNRRISGCYTNIIGSFDVMGHKKARLQDRQNVLASHETPKPFRDLLLEDNPDGIIEVDIASPNPRAEMFIRNPITGAWIMVGADLMPYTHPQYPSSKPLSPIGEAAMRYAEGIKTDVVKGYLAAERLLFVVRQMASFENKLQYND